jgi:UDP-N-acetylmuramyl pentapeptide phosphotransferase/UDP-N-acetylglucosamine-1-phosphate transferase
MFYTILFFLLFIVALITTGKMITYLIEDNNEYKKQCERRSRQGRTPR